MSTVLDLIFCAGCQISTAVYLGDVPRRGGWVHSDEGWFCRACATRLLCWRPGCDHSQARHQGGACRAPGCRCPAYLGRRAVGRRLG